MLGPNSWLHTNGINVGFKTISLNERASEIMIEFGKLKKSLKTLVPLLKN